MLKPDSSFEVLFVGGSVECSSLLEILDREMEEVKRDAQANGSKTLMHS